MVVTNWRCEHCGASGLVKPTWGDHAGDIISDTHRDRDFPCDREHGTTGIRVSGVRAQANAI